MKMRKQFVGSMVAAAALLMTVSTSSAAFAEDVLDQWAGRQGAPAISQSVNHPADTAQATKVAEVAPIRNVAPADNNDVFTQWLRQGPQSSGLASLKAPARHANAPGVERGSGIVGSQPSVAPSHGPDTPDALQQYIGR